MLEPVKGLGAGVVGPWAVGLWPGVAGSFLCTQEASPSGREVVAPCHREEKKMAVDSGPDRKGARSAMPEKGRHERNTCDLRWSR